jgi:hypothetical protein
VPQAGAQRGVVQRARVVLEPLVLVSRSTATFERAGDGRGTEPATDIPVAVYAVSQFFPHCAVVHGHDDDADGKDEQ